MEASASSPPPLSSFFSQEWARVGATVAETSQLLIRVMVTTVKRLPAYSPTADLAKAIGIKLAQVIMVPVSSGLAQLSKAKEQALIRSQPSLIFVSIISTTTTESSTSMPSATIRAPRDILCKSIPARNIPTMLHISTRGMQTEMT